MESSRDRRRPKRSWTDTQLADWLTDPANGVPRLYVVTVRGRVGPEEHAALERGLNERGEMLKASAVRLRKASARESHLIVELRKGKNREVRRLFRSVGHEAARLKRVSFGGLELGSLAPGEWRAIDAAELHKALPERRRRKARKV